MWLSSPSFTESGVGVSREGELSVKSIKHTRFPGLGLSCVKSTILESERSGESVITMVLVSESPWQFFSLFAGMVGVLSAGEGWGRGSVGRGFNGGVVTGAVGRGFNGGSVTGSVGRGFNGGLVTGAVGRGFNEGSVTSLVGRGFNGGAVTGAVGRGFNGVTLKSEESEVCSIAGCFPEGAECGAMEVARLSGWDEGHSVPSGKLLVRFPAEIITKPSGWNNGDFASSCKLLVSRFPGGVEIITKLSSWDEGHSVPSCKLLASRFLGGVGISTKPSGWDDGDFASSCKLLADRFPGGSKYGEAEVTELSGWSFSTCSTLLGAVLSRASGFRFEK